MVRSLAVVAGRVDEGHPLVQGEVQDHLGRGLADLRQLDGAEADA